MLRSVVYLAQQAVRKGRINFALWDRSDLCCRTHMTAGQRGVPHGSVHVNSVSYQGWMYILWTMQYVDVYNMNLLELRGKEVEFLLLFVRMKNMRRSRRCADLEAALEATDGTYSVLYMYRALYRPLCVYPAEARTPVSRPLTLPPRTNEGRL